MSSTWEELQFYGQLASTLFAPKYDLPKVPGPKGNFALGNITAVMRPDYHVQMLEWANKYGGVYKFSLGFQWVVVVSDPKIAVQVLGRGPGSIPRKCVGYKFFDLATNAAGLHSFFTTSDETQWAAVRKAAAVAFSSANVRKAFPVALRHARLVAASLDPSSCDPTNPYLELTQHQINCSQEKQRHPYCYESEPLSPPQQTQVGGGELPVSSETKLAASDDASAGAVSVDDRRSDGSLAGSSSRSGSSNNKAEGGKQAAPAAPPNQVAAVDANPCTPRPQDMLAVTKHSSDRTSWSQWLWSLGAKTAAAPAAASATAAAVRGVSEEGEAGAGIHIEEAVQIPYGTAVVAAGSDHDHAPAGPCWAPVAVEDDDTRLAAVMSMSPPQRQLPGPCTCGHCENRGRWSLTAALPLEPCAVAAHEIQGGCSDADSECVSSDGVCNDGSSRSSISGARGGRPSASVVAENGGIWGHRTNDVVKATANAGVAATAATADSAAPATTAKGVLADIQEHLELSMLHVFVEALFEIRPQEFPGRQVASDMNLVLEEANERLKVPLRKITMALVRPQAQARVRAAQLRLAKVYGEMYDIIRSRGSPVLPPEGVTDLWACLGRVRHPVTGAPLGRDVLVPEIGALMMAGFDTSSHSVAWVLFALAAHPEIQQRCRQELAARGLLTGRYGSPARDPSLDDLTQLPYLNAVIDETMRMFPVAATASVREVTQPTRVGDYVIPPGVIVWPMLYALHNSTHNWAEPDKFIPERWMAVGGDSGSGAHGEGVVGMGSGDDDDGSTHGRSGSLLSMPHTSMNSMAARNGGSGGSGGGGSAAGSMAAAADGGSGGKRFMPFSDGMKSCLGQALGLMEVRTMLVVLLGRYSFELDSALGGAEAVRRNMIMSLTLKIKGGLRLVCTPLHGSEDRCDVS